MNSKLSGAIAAILGSLSCGGALAAAAEGGDALEEITVTAQRRTESMQNVPISMQAFTSQSLQQLNILTFDDYIKYLPNVTAANNGPGQNEVFMRGLSAGSQASQGSAATGLLPNVAVYLDNQSAQMPNRNLDIYAADLNRIEVLEGPQGTLFGSGAEAGVIRYITNEPKIDVTEGSVKAGYGTTAHGDPNSDVTAVLNLPVIAEHVAVRAVIYDDQRGGYINNVPGTFTRQNTDIGISYANLPAVNGSCPNGLPPGAPQGPNNTRYCVPPGSPSINNANQVANAINPVTYEGIRGQLLYKINDDWDALLAQTYQDTHSSGVFYQQPNASDGAPLAPLEVTLFNPAQNKDKFENTSLTVNGKFGPLKAVYTGGYLVRHVDQTGDYTNYSRGVYADYYQCVGKYDLTPKCYSPSASWHSIEKNEHMQHEFRVSTPDDWRVRGIVGAFYEDNKLFDETSWMYKSVPECTAAVTVGCFANLGTFPDTTVQNPGVQPHATSFYQDSVRETTQTAFFASTDIDLIPKTLILTLGTRHFQFENSYKGSVMSSFYCYEAAVTPGGCLGANGVTSFDLDGQHLSDTESGFKSRANLSWHITPDAMLYYTWSQGFRPGGFNQNGGSTHIPGTDGLNQYAIPKSLHSDQLTNNEIGWKTEFFDHRFQWNGAFYRENWDNVQISFFDPGLVGNIFFNTNGQNFVVKGAETSVVAKIISGLTVQGAASWNQSRQTNSPVFIDNVVGSNNYGKPITQVCTIVTGANCGAVTNPFGPVGSPTANSPPLQFSLRARYEWTYGDYNAFAQAGASHTGHSFTQAGSNPTFAGGGNISTSRLRFEDPAYTTYSASIGVAKDAWNVMLTGENITNSNAATFTSTDQFIVEQTPLRPRTLGVSIGYKF